MELPSPGVRVMIRYRLPAGSEPPLSDVVGHLVEVGPTLRVRTKHDDIVDVSVDDVVVLKELPPATVRTADIRKLEHAAALGWPGTEQQWVDGWLLRAADGHTHRGNSAVPLGFEASASALPTIVQWYTTRGLTPWLSIPDRLFRLAQGAPHLETVVMARGVEPVDLQHDVTLAAIPDADWLQTYERDVPVEVLTAVVEGDVVFASIKGAAVGRGAVTQAMDGGRWLGLSAVRVDEGQRRRGHARTLCSALMAWGAEHGATRCYTQVLAENAPAIMLYESMGFTIHHRSRYMKAGLV
jgi:GNAT superfamily N-acetyltransferase